MPQRRCVACGTVAPKGRLHRVALDEDRVVSDPSQRRPGRGAYVCDAGCAQRAVKRRAFGRAFRRAVSPADDLVESIGTHG